MFEAASRSNFLATTLSIYKTKNQPSVSVKQLAAHEKARPARLAVRPTLVMRTPSKSTEMRTAPNLPEARADLLHAAFQIHNGPAQYLANALMRLRLCERYLSEDVPRAQSILRESLAGVQTALDAVRATIDMLRSPRVTSGTALDWGLHAMVNRLRSTSSIEFYEDIEDVGPLPYAIAAGLWEIGCEALTNAATHGGATHITIGLHKRQDEITLEVVDNGRGFTWPKVNRRRRRRSSAGVALMQERARRLGGTLSIRSDRPVGTLVRAVLPVPSPSATLFEQGKQLMHLP